MPSVAEVGGLPFAICLVATSLCAQVEPPAWRVHSSAECYYELTGPSEDGGLFLIQSGVLGWVKFKPEPQPGEVITDELTLAMFDRNGGIAQVGESADFLISGLDSQASIGRLCLARLRRDAPRGLTLVEQLALGTDVDPISVIYNRDSGHIVVLDRRQKRLLAASWVPGAPLAGTVFTAVLDPSTAAFLGDGHEDWNLGEDRLGPGILVEHEGLAFGHWLAQVTQGTLSAQQPPGAIVPPTAFQVGDSEVASAFWPLRLTGPTGPFEIVDLDTGTSVATGVLAGGGVWFEFTPAGAAPMSAGHAHEVRATGVDPARFLPLFRYGSPSVTAAMRAYAGRTAWDLNFVGSDRFAVASLAALEGATPGTRFDAQFHLWIAATSESDPPPIVTIGTTVVLVAGALLGPFPRTVTDEHPVARIGVPFPIPDLPDLAGARAWFQFATLDPSGQAVLTDVFGLPIEPSPTQLGSSSSAGRLQRLACRRFLAGMSSNESRLFYQRCIESLRRR